MLFYPHDRIMIVGWINVVLEDIDEVYIPHIDLTPVGE